MRTWLRSQYSQKEHCIEALKIKEICFDHLAVQTDVMKDLPVTQLDLVDVVMTPTSAFGTNVDVLISADYYTEKS